MQDRSRFKKGIKIALVGKGGTGKSAIAAMIIKVLCDEDKFRILAIDADPAMGLADALGIKVYSTIANISDKMRGEAGFRGKMADIHISNVIREIVQHEHGFDMLCLGHDESPGCYCGINELLKYGIACLSQAVDVVIIDGEAGIEQMKRRVLDKVDVMIGITDMSARGRRIADLLNSMAHVSGQMIEQCDVVLVFNKVRKGFECLQDSFEQTGARIVGYVPQDENILEFDVKGRSLLELPENTPAIIATRPILKEIGLIFDSNKLLH